jgi:hypothetical protein
MAHDNPTFKNPANSGKRCNNSPYAGKDPPPALYNPYDPTFCIDFRKLADSIDYFKSVGYEQLPVPWLVSAESGDATKPSWAIPMDTYGGRLVASGENGFLELIKQGTLKPGKYVTCTPCFRAEPTIDATHKLWFQKVELIDTMDFDFRALLEDALAFFSRYVDCRIEELEDGTSDIVTVDGGIELGSYGLRELPNFGKWAYGTGCAEPRLSYTQHLAKISQAKKEAL